MWSTFLVVNLVLESLCGIWFGLLIWFIFCSSWELGRARCALVWVESVEIPVGIGWLSCEQRKGSSLCVCVCEGFIAVDRSVFWSVAIIGFAFRWCSISCFGICCVFCWDYSSFLSMKCLWMVSLYWRLGVVLVARVDRGKRWNFASCGDWGWGRIELDCVL